MAVRIAAVSRFTPMAGSMISGTCCGKILLSLKRKFNGPATARAGNAPKSRWLRSPRSSRLRRSRRRMGARSPRFRRELRAGIRGEVRRGAASGRRPISPDRPPAIEQMRAGQRKCSTPFRPSDSQTRAAVERGGEGARSDDRGEAEREEAKHGCRARGNRGRLSRQSAGVRTSGWPDDDHAAVVGTIAELSRPYFAKFARVSGRARPGGALDGDVARFRESPSKREPRTSASARRCSASAEGVSRC